MVVEEGWKGRSKVKKAGQKQKEGDLSDKLVNRSTLR